LELAFVVPDVRGARETEKVDGEVEDEDNLALEGVKLVGVFSNVGDDV
jgi:hypothetical protein